MIQLINDARQLLHELVGFIGYVCLTVGVLMLLFSVLGGRFQGDKMVRAAVTIGAGALLMNFAQAYL